MNSVNLIGNLTRDPELRSTTDGGSVCAMRLAVNGRGDQDPVYVDVTTFGAQADSCAEYLSKGRQVAVSGRLHYSEWDAKDGSGRRSRLQVIGNVKFLGSPNGEEPSEAPAEGDDEIEF
jgi:single-strand DNA-binding protein